MNVVLDIQDLSKSFDGLNLFYEASFSLEGRSLNSLFGGNGTGKTTLFNMITGFDNPDSGSITFLGENVFNYKSYQLAQMGIGKLWQNPTIFPNHTLLENLLISNKNNRSESFFGFLNIGDKSINDRQFLGVAESVLRKLGLFEKRNVLAGSISYGQTKLLGLGMLLCNKPSLYLLDEPFSNIGTKTIDVMCESLRDVAKQGGTILMIEHKTTIAKSLSDNIYRIDNHKIELITE